MITKEDRAKLRELVAELPAEVWEYDEPSNWFGLNGRLFIREPYGLVGTINIEGWRPKKWATARGKFIAASRTALPLLLDTVETLEAERDGLREALRLERKACNSLEDQYNAMWDWRRPAEAALEKIGRDHQCGCKPCTQQCLSQEALQITVDEMREIARAALSPQTQKQALDGGGA